MEDRLVKLLDMLISTLEKGGDLIGTHVPAFFKEILEYEFMYSAIFTGFFGFLFVLCLLIWLVSAVKGLPKILSDESMSTSIWMLVFSSLGLFVIGLVIQSYAKDVIKIKMAPRVYTLEYLRDFKAGKR